MSISIFYLPRYKTLKYNEFYKELYLKGKAVSCKEGELEEFLPIWLKFLQGSYPGNLMNFKRRIRKDEYNKYPIIFITSDYWGATEDSNAHGSTNVHICAVQTNTPKEWYEHLETFDNRLIDRETGVIVLEKTIIHGNVKEPNFKNWVCEKDQRMELPDNILKDDFFQIDIMKNKKGPGYFLSIEAYKPFPNFFSVCEVPEGYDNSYVKRYGYLSGPNIEEFVKKYTFSSANSKSLELIEWDNSWNFVVEDEFGQSMFKVDKAKAKEFFERNEISFKS